MEFKDRLKAVRKALKLTQTDFGARIGIKGNTITGYETGIRNPSDAVIFSICREFNVNEDYLRNGKGDMFLSFSPYEKAYNRFGYIMENSSASKKAALSVLLELLYSVPDDTWDSIISQFDSLKNND